MKGGEAEGKGSAGAQDVGRSKVLSTRKTPILTGVAIVRYVMRKVRLEIRRGGGGGGREGV